MCSKIGKRCQKVGIPPLNNRVEDLFLKCHNAPQHAVESEVAQEQNIFPRGDVNGDGLVNLADAMLIRQVLQGVRSTSNPIFDVTGFMNGDVNYDGATNATDAKMIAQYVAGLRDLPTPPAHTQKLLFYHSDHLGGSNIITDGSGNLVQHVQYSPYGEIDYELNLGVSVNYLFTGQEFDREAGLYYYNARYYDPEIGRFIQPDTINDWKMPRKKFQSLEKPFVAVLRLKHPEIQTTICCAYNVPGASCSRIGELEAPPHFH